MRKILDRGRRLSIRTYRRPLPLPNNFASHPELRIFEAMPFEEVFVVCETPLLEFTQKDLVFLRECGIDPFRD
jgi:hypothetical protein